MRLKNATLAVIIGTALAFVLRAVGTAFPRLFRNLWVARISTSFFVLLSAAILLFYVYFYTDYLRTEQTRLKTAAAWAIFGHSALVFMFVREFLGIFGIDFLPEILQSPRVEVAMPFVPWINSALILIFLVVLHREDHPKERMRLRRAKCYAVIAAVLLVLIRTLVGFFYLFGGGAGWFSSLKKPLFLAAIPFVTASFLLFEYFFLSFYKGRDLVLKKPDSLSS